MVKKCKAVHVLKTVLSWRQLEADVLSWRQLEAELSEVSELEVVRGRDELELVRLLCS